MSDIKRIIVIEDEESISDIISYSLRKEGYFVQCAFSGKEAFPLIESVQPSLILLDVMLPDTSGFDICKTIVQDFPHIPVIMLTARNDIVDKILGLELGADDYITKPFDIRELLTRVKVSLRRVQSLPETNHYIKINDLIKADPTSRTVFKEDEEVKIKPKEYELLLLLAENKDRVFSREEILDYVWDIDYDGDLRTVDVHVQRLRKKLDIDSYPSIIDTVFGIGYKMKGFK
ncbi:DNA-binding response regulator [Anaerobacillus alkalidiazotrophicus]|uniref:DNA-binding response regulator n=1 Tax=Anaerobacillus alkalidiazotrophicus TaxID=472963 RepID=A0A1S2M9T8_9BACI|nr:response regulator transcription factor [Anaerobacillus alkalidiazotrophicus]OIJ21512.1 DNA-binding response regulator [Anaerobacillus alkalidiazotrophicus]